jgi:hypothetical protein
MIFRKFHVFLIFFCFISVTQIAEAKQNGSLKPIAKVYKINYDKEIILASPDATQIKMGDKVFVIADKRAIILNITFPMMTIVKAKTAPKYERYFNRIRKGMPVFKYHPGDEYQDYNNINIDNEEIGDGILEISSTKPGKINLLHEGDWYSILQSFRNAIGLDTPDKDSVKQITIETIKNPDNEKLISSNNIIQIISDSLDGTPCAFRNLKEGNYYVFQKSEDDSKTLVKFIYLQKSEKKAIKLGEKKIYVNSYPERSDIYLDGVIQNLQTPAHLYLPYEYNKEVHLTVKHEGYYDHKKTIQLKDDEMENLQFDLTQIEKKGYLAVSTFPSGAYISINGSYIGFSPLKTEVKPGMDIRITAEKNGYKSQSVNVTLSDEGETREVPLFLDEEKKHNDEEYARKDTEFNQYYSHLSINFGTGYLRDAGKSCISGMEVPVDFFNNTFKDAKNNFYAIDTTWVIGKWAGLVISSSLTVSPFDQTTYNISNKTILDLSFGLGFIPRVWRFYFLAAFCAVINIEFNRPDFGMGFQWLASAGFMISENIGINAGIKSKGIDLFNSGPKNHWLSLGATTIFVGLSVGIDIK